MAHDQWTGPDIQMLQRGTSEKDTARVGRPTRDERSLCDRAVPVAPRDVEYLIHIPPALPPPRYNHDLENGIDVAWALQNAASPGGLHELPPIRAGSSLLGSHSNQPDDCGETIESCDHNIHELCALDRCTRSSMPPDLSMRDDIRSISDRSAHASSGINPSLHGDNPLAQRSNIQSAQAYDKQLLSRIGRAVPPERPRSRMTSKDYSSASTKADIQSLALRQVNRPLQISTSPSTSTADWTTSPTLTCSVRQQGEWERFPPMLRSDSSHQNAQRTQCERFDTTDCNMSGSEQSISEDAQVVRPLHVSSSSMPPSSLESNTFSFRRPTDRPHVSNLHDVKRRALSPTAIHEQTTANRGGSTSSFDHDLPSAMIRQPYTVGSLSSAGSSQIISSYTSSCAPQSFTDSVTSVSSHEIRGLSRDSNLSQKDLGLSLNRNKLNPVSTRMLSQAMNLSPIDNEDVPGAVRVGNHLMCTCCSKKPKKFETLEQLIIHQEEKQYSCSYCNNRFKNKNEAERHQNSLHVRKQSWSCGALQQYQAAFQTLTYSTGRGSSKDACGYCGQEFDNNANTWQERIDHLSDVHRFRECNTTKKFYRADHFRQHLKHSHAGKSGKWTNILESSCLREEVGLESASLSPTTSDHSQPETSGQRPPQRRSGDLIHGMGEDFE